MQAGPTQGSIYEDKFASACLYTSCCWVSRDVADTPFQSEYDEGKTGRNPDRWHWQKQTDHFNQILPVANAGHRHSHKFRPRIFTQDSFGDHALLLSANKALEHHALPAQCHRLGNKLHPDFGRTLKFGLFGLLCGATTSDMSLARSKLLFPPHQAQASLSACISSLSLATCSCKLSMLTCFPPVSIARGREQNARGLRGLNGTFSHFNSVADTRVLVSLPKLLTGCFLISKRVSWLLSLSRARQQSRLC